MTHATILLADDEDTLRETLARVLRGEGFEVVACRDGAAALKALRLGEFDALITDLRMPSIPGMDLVDHAHRLAPRAIIMVITAFGEVETAVEAMRKGVHDYICKPLILDEVVFKLKRLLAQRDMAHENRALRDHVPQIDASQVIGDDGNGSSILTHPLPYAGAIYFDANLKAAVHEFERMHITAILEHLHGNKIEAAHQLGIGLSSLYRKLDELGIDKGCTDTSRNGADQSPVDVCAESTFANGVKT